MTDTRFLFLDLMKRCLTNIIYGDPGYTPGKNASDFQIVRRFEGLDWPVIAHTMIGLKRLQNIQACVEDVLARNIEGDLIETGVWRGGATIFMRAILKAWEVEDRTVWVADSFEGLPPPNATQYPEDANSRFHTFEQLAVTIEEVRRNFQLYNLLDDQVKFLKGWFKDTLPAAPFEKLAVMRLDGDMYESTMDALVNLYPKLSIGGYAIIDDYNDIPACRKAVDDYRAANKITDPMDGIDWSGVFWMKSGKVPV